MAVYVNTIHLHFAYCILLSLSKYFLVEHLCFSWLQLVGSDIYVKNKCGYGILNWLHYNSY